MDADGFRSLVAAQFDDIWRFARRRCPSGTEADDVTAEVFAVAWRRRDDLPAGDGARLWLFGTARLVLANQRRGDRRRAGLTDRLTAVPPPTGPSDPADEVAAGADGSPLWAALAALDEDDREVLLLRAWDELPVADIAALLGCTPNAASLRLRKARGRLADGLRSSTSGATTAASRTDPPSSRTSDGRAPTPGGGPR